MGGNEVKTTVGGILQHMQFLDNMQGFNKARWRLVDLLTCTQPSGLDAGTAKSTPANLASPQSGRRPSGITSKAAADVKRSLRNLFKKHSISSETTSALYVSPVHDSRLQTSYAGMPTQETWQVSLTNEPLSKQQPKVRATFHLLQGNFKIAN